MLGELKTVDLIFFSFLIVFLFLDLGLGVSMTSWMTVTKLSHNHVTVSHTHHMSHVTWKDREGSRIITSYNMFTTC